MNIERYRPNGAKDVTHNVTPAAADRIFSAHEPMVRTPFSRYYRITMVNDQGRIVRDTDHEIYGRQTIAPGTLMFHGKDATHAR
jgi:hypothetical protein